MALTPERIDALLADFRQFLEGLTDAPDPGPEPPAVDLASVVAQVAALRHDVQLSVKAVRAAAESRPADAEPPGEVRDAVEALVGVADALHLSLRQIDKARDALEASMVAFALEELPPAPNPPAPRRRLFGGPLPPDPWPAWADAVGKLWEATRVRRQAELEKTRAWLAGVADGYSLSLRRVEKLWPKLAVEPLAVEGEAFDPETMEAVELAPGGEPGRVAAELRRGYRWRGKLLRPAQVRVTK